MKLLFCPYCRDIVKLTLEEKHCNCRQCFGNYLEDRRTVEVSSDSVVFCIDSLLFTKAVLNTRPTDLLGKNFNAWVLPYLNRWRKTK